MSVLGHIAIGVVTARAITPPESGGDRLPTRMAGLAALALLPDSDFLLHEMAPRLELFDHRGATHSLAIALTIGLLAAALVAATRGDHPARWGLVIGLVVASHGLMDSVGDSSLGVELLWPFSDARLLAPWQLLPDPSLTPPLSQNLFGALAAEAVVFVPAWIYAFFPRSLVAGLSRREPGR